MVFTKWNKINGNYYGYLAQSYRVKGDPNPHHKILGYYGAKGKPATKARTRYYTHARPRDIGELAPPTLIHSTISKQSLIPHLASKKWVAEGKVNGSRHYLYARRNPNSVALINRRDVNATEKFPELWSLPNKLRFKKTAVIDGEIAYTSKQFKYGSFKKLAMREHLKDKEKIKKRTEEIPLIFYAFDIVEKDEKPLVDLPLVERKKILDKTVPDNLPNIKEIKYTFNFGKLMDDVQKHDGEGVVFKHVDSPYEEGKKTKWWYKKKYRKENDITILAYTPGTGERKNLFGAIVGGVYIPKTKNYKIIGKIGTGFKREELKRLKSKMDKIKSKKMPKISGDIPAGLEGATWLTPQLVSRVMFQQITEQGRYRAPVYISERLDIGPETTHAKT